LNKNPKRKSEMRKMKYSIVALGLVAFMASCGSHSHDAEGNHTEEHAHEHDHSDHEGHDHAHEAPEGVVMQEIAEGQKVFFANLEDGAIVTSPVTVEFGVEGMEVEPAGEIKENSGHHHLLINHDFIAAGEVIPAGDSTKLHFGNGQTSTEVNLEPGDYTFTMQFANGAHMSYGEKMSATINVSVEAEAKHMGDE
jgi:hypothetical protein